MKFDMCFKNIKKIQFNIKIFKICNHINLFSESCNLSLQSNFSLNFDPLTINQVLKKKKGDAQENFYGTKILKKIIICNINNETIM